MDLAVVPFDRVAHMGSSVAAAFVGSAFQPDGHLPSCSLVQVVAVPDLVEDSVHGHPTVGLVGLLLYRQADMLGDAHPVVVVLPLGWADHLLAGL